MKHESFCIFTQLLQLFLLVWLVAFNILGDIGRKR